MSSFNSKLILEPLDDGRRWKLVEPFVYEIGKLGSGNKIEVPAGFITDFASVPRGLWNIFPPWGVYGKAAILHDWLYQEQKRTRAESDKIFLEAMKALGVSFLKRRLIYRGVRLGGWLAWRSHKKQLKQATAI